MSAEAAASDNQQAVVLYDADAEQRMAFRTERRVKGVAQMFPVVHIFGAITEEPVLAYERERGQSIGSAEAQEIDQTGGTSIEARKGSQAAINYWNSTGARAEGYAGKVSDQDKIFAVNNMLFGFEFEELSMANSDELCPEESDGDSTYRARCIFDGHVIEVSATLRAATSEEISEFTRLMSRTILVRGQNFGKQDMIIPSKAKRLAEMFDSMKVAVSGYRNRVPLHHKVAYANRHFKSEQTAITGN